MLTQNVSHSFTYIQEIFARNFKANFFDHKVHKRISPWDRGQISIKLGTKHVMYQKLENFM